MVDESKTPEMEKVLELGRRIRARIQEFKERGAFSDTRAAFLRDAEAKCAQIDSKVQSAVAKGESRDAIALEAERDYDGLQLELLRWIERADESAMKSR